MLALLQAAAAASVLPLAYGRELSGLQTNLGRVTDASVTYSKNVSHCPGQYRPFAADAPCSRRILRLRAELRPRNIFRTYREPQPRWCTVHGVRPGHQEPHHPGVV
jgi:hypothetical protein